MAQRQGRSAGEAAADQVRTIVEAAEQSAASLEAAAREDAARIRSEAEADASGTREAAERLAVRADELERRVDDLVGGVRAATAALKEELATLRAAASRPAAPESAASAPVPEPAGPAPESESASPAPLGEPAASEGRAPEGARVLALKMALDGTSREDTARYLGENFHLDDPEALLDEVYARAGR